MQPIILRNAERIALKELVRRFRRDGRFAHQASSFFHNAFIGYSILESFHDYNWFGE